MGKTLRLAVFWAKNALIDRAEYRQEPATDVARRHLAKARDIFARHGFKLDVRPLGALASPSAATGHELASWTMPIAADIAMYGIRGVAGAGPIVLENRLPVIFCRFARTMVLSTPKPPYVLIPDTTYTLGWTVSKTLEASSGIFHGCPFKPFVLMNSLMNAKDPTKAGGLAHEIAHAADLRHSDDPRNLLFEDANRQGETLSKAQAAQIGKAYFAA